MTSKPWMFSDHALSRAASRFGLLIDMSAQAKIQNALNSPSATVVTRQDRDGVILYEISVLGTKFIAVCNMVDRVVITLLDAKRWYRGKHAAKRWYATKRRSFKTEDGEEE